MQTISSILKIERGIGTWVTDTGAADYAPSFPLGVLATLSIDLRGPLKSEAFAPSLPAYPIQELQGLSLLMVMDLDYDQATPPRFIRTSGITLSEDEQGHLLCTVPLPDTNTEAMREALSTAETRAFQCELIGRNAEGQDAFAVQFSLTVRNRVLLGEATEAPDTDSPEWLPTVTAIVQEVVAQNAGSLKGEKGESAYSTWLSQGNTGTEEDFLASLKGESQKGDKGDPGSLAMGTVSTLSPGEKATASIQEGLLHLGIPQGEKGKDGTALCYAFSPESAPDSSAWHQHCQKTDLYWRISEDAGATWSHAMPLSQAPVSPIARFSPVAQDTDAQWKTPEDMGDYAQLHDGAAYFRVKMKGYPWTEPRLISATSGMESMTQEQIQEAEDVLKATTIRASFSSDNVSWHASIQEGDLYLRFFSTTGTVLAIWDLSDFGSDHCLQGLQAASQGAPWHEYPREGDRFMKISLDGGETWFSKCFQVEGAPGKASSLSIGRVETLPAGSQATASITGEPPDQVLNLGIPKGEDGTGSSSSYTLPPATPDTLGGVKVGRGLSITEDGTLSATGASGTSQAEWGGIGGTLSNQSDLKEALEAKAEKSAVDAHVEDSSIHVTSEEKDAWDAKAAKSHTHAMGDITGLPASGGTAGQVLTKTATGAEWADAPSGGTSGEGGTDAGAVRVVKNYADYLDVSSLASEQAIHHSATFIPAADVTGDTIEVRKAISGEVTDDTLRKGRIYVQINEGGTGSAATREVTTSTYVVQKVRIVNSSTGGTYGNWVIISGREGTPYLYPDSYEKAYGGQHGFTFADRQALEDTYLNGGWPTVSLNAQSLLGAYKADLEQDGTYIGTTPWYAADAKTSGEVLKRVNGVWRKGNVAYNSSTGETSESFDEATEYKIVLLFTDSSGSYQDTLTPNSTETAIEHNTMLGNPIIDCLDITPDPLRLAIQALEGAALEVSPGKAYSATLTDNATLSATLGEYGYRQEAYLDVNPGAYSLTPGGGLTFAQELTASKVNHCRIVWTGTSARLLVDDVTDAAASGGESGGGSEGTGGGGETGGETGGGGSFPTTFTVTACDGNGAAVGDYARTDSTTTVSGKDYPVYSMTQELLGTIFYIYVCGYQMGSAGVFWALKADSYSASDDSYGALGSCAAGTDGLPMGSAWSSSSSTTTVTWA